MAGTKYTAAPQRDSLDDAADYPQGPPSYQNAPSSSRDKDTLLGAPRSSEDNIPDDFKVCIASETGACLASTDVCIVRRLRRGGDPRHSNAIHSQGLCYLVRIVEFEFVYHGANYFQNCAAPGDRCVEFDILLPCRV